MQSFKGPFKKLKPVKPSAALQGRHITMPHLALCYKRKSSSTCGSNRSTGRRPRHGNTKPHARNSILGVHHSDHDSNSRRHPGDRSLQPLMWLLCLLLLQWAVSQAPRMVALLLWMLVVRVQEMVHCWGQLGHQRARHLREQSLRRQCHHV